MTIEFLLLIIFILIFLAFFSQRHHSWRIKMENPYVYKSPNTTTSETNTTSTTTNTASENTSTESSTSTTSSNSKTEIENTCNEITEEQVAQVVIPADACGNKLTSSDIINDYLSEVKCEEHFKTMGPDMNMGNDMDFTIKVMPRISAFDIAISKSLVPDFEPSALNINPNLNSFGYARNNNNSCNNKGYLNPTDAADYANKINQDLSNSYQKRYFFK